MKKFKFLMLIFTLVLGVCYFSSCDSNSGDLGDEIIDSDSDQRMKIYNLAVESGYDGTYEEWLSSIKGDYIQLSVTDTHIVWKYSMDTVWTNLVELSKFAGQDGTPGKDGVDGVDGKTPEFRINDGYLEWKYTTDSSWKKLYEVEEKEEVEYCDVTISVINLGINKTIKVEKGELITDLSSVLPERYKFDYAYTYDTFTGRHYEWIFDVYTVNKDLNIVIDKAYEVYTVQIMDLNGNLYSQYEHASYNYFEPGTYFEGYYVEWYLDADHTVKFEPCYITSDITLYPKRPDLVSCYVVFGDNYEFNDNYKIENNFPGSSNYIELYLEAGTEFVVTDKNNNKYYDANNISYDQIYFEGTNALRVKVSGLYRIQIYDYDYTYESCSISLIHAYEKPSVDDIIDDYFYYDDYFYTVNKNEDGLEIKKNGNDSYSEWANLRTSISANEILDYNKLVVELYGEEGAEIIFKVADQKEFKVICTGTTETYEFYFRLSSVYANSSALYIFAEPGKFGDGKQYIITKLGFEYDPNNDFEVNMSNKVIYSDYDYTNYIHSVSLTLFPGDSFDILLADENIMAKNPNITGCLNNGSTNENYLSLVDNSLVLPIENTNKVRYDLTYNITTNTLNIDATALGNVNFDCIANGFVENDYNSYVISDENGVLTIAKTHDGSEYSYIKSNLTGEDISGATKLVITIKGEVGEKIIFKVNDTYEQWITCSGYTETVVMDFSHITINSSKSALLIFAGAGSYGATGLFEITELYFE